MKLCETNYKNSIIHQVASLLYDYFNMHQSQIYRVGTII